MRTSYEGLLAGLGFAILLVYFLDRRQFSVLA